MKKILNPLHGQAQAVLRKCLILFTMLLTVGLSARAQVFEVGNLRYKVLSEANRTAKVVGYIGKTTDVVISETVEKGGVKYSVTRIDNAAFENDHNMVSVTIPNSVTSIGARAFDGCDALTSVTIPNSVTEIKSGPFANCTSLEKILVDEGNINFISDNGILYNKDMTKLIQFPGARKEVVIPNSVTNIGWTAFEGSTFLTSVTIPNSVTEIGEFAFSECTSLASVTVPNSVIRIGSSAFSDCTSLASVTIPNSVAFISFSLFDNCTSLVSVTIPNSVICIQGGAFGDCTSLTSVTIPNSVTEIGECAFSGCRSLNSIAIPNSVTEIVSGTFEYCTSLTSVTIPNSVTRIGGEAFRSCTSLTSVTIPNSVTEIGWRAFGFCESLKNVYSESTTPPQADEQTFKDVPADAVLYVPEGTKEAYSQAEGWKYFFDMREKSFSGVSELIVDRNAGSVDVYNMQGMLVKSKALQADVDTLAPGLYIIGGRKVLVK